MGKTEFLQSNYLRSDYLCKFLKIFGMFTRDITISAVQEKNCITKENPDRM